VVLLPYIDKDRINIYGVSLRGDLVVNLSARTKVNAAILGAPAPFNFLGLSFPTRENPKPAVTPEIAARNTAAVQCPILIFAGTADQLLPLDRDFCERLEKAGKNVTLEIYQDGYHDS
jgi:dienelactone hydrolase